MNKWTIFAIASSSTVGAVMVSLIILAIISRKVYHRSLMATFVVWFFRLTVHHKSDEQVQADVNLLPLKNDVPYVVPRQVRTRKQQRYVYEGMTVIAVNMQRDNDRVVLYLHGGGYVRQPRIHHWKYLNRLAAKVGNVVVPIYPKAPNHNPQEVIELMTNLYAQLLEQYRTVVLMGDSSGGGLALTLCEYWGEIGVQQPSKLIVFSPWVDVSLSNPELEQYQRVDPLISLSSERIWAKMWAHDMDLDDYRLSPMYGRLDKLPQVVMYCGDREILYPDVCKMYSLMNSSGVAVKYIVGRGMNHVYQIYPIPEAKKALKEVVEEINNID